MKSQLTPSPSIDFARKSIRNSINLYLLILLFTFNYISAFGQDSIYYDFFDQNDLIELSIPELKQSNLQSIQANYLHQKIWAPDTNSGILPKELLYLPEQDKHVIYSDRRILVMDNQYQIIQTIDISNHANLLPWARPLLQDYIDKRMALNSLTNNELYCCTDDNVLKVISLNNYQIIASIKPENSLYYNAFSFIKFNEATNEIYWIMNGLDFENPSNYHSRFICVNADTKEIVYDTIYETGYESGFIMDILIHPYRERYYVSHLKIANNPVYSEVLINDFNHNNLRTIPLDTLTTPDNYIHHFDYYSNPTYGDRVFCLSHSVEIPGTVAFILVLDAEYDMGDIYVEQIGFGSITCSYLDTLNNRYYTGYNNYNNGAWDYSLKMSYPDSLHLGAYWCDTVNSKPLKFCSNPNDTIVYCTLENYIVGIDPDLNSFNSGGFSYYFLNKRMLDIAFDNTNEKVIALGFLGGSVEILNPSNLQHEESIPVGIFSPKGIYNSINEKVYSFHSIYMTDNRIIIFDNVKHEIDFMELYGKINNLVFDSLNNVIYITKPDTIKIFNCADNIMMNECISFSNTEHFQKAFIGENQKLYVVVKDYLSCFRLDIFDLSDFPVIDSLSSIEITDELEILRLDGHFIYNDVLQPDEIYISLYGSNRENTLFFGTVIGIDPVTDEKLFSRDIDLPVDMAYNQLTNKLYFNCFSDSIGVLELDNINNFSTVDIPGNIYDIEFSDFSNLLYIATSNDNIRFINGVDDQLLGKEELQLLDTPVKLYNDRNDKKMYFYVPVSFEADKLGEEQLYIYDEENFSLKNIGFNNIENMLWFYYPDKKFRIPKHDLIFDKTNDQMFISNGHSIINIIKDEMECDNFQYENYIYYAGDDITWTEDKYIDKYIILNDSSKLTIDSTSTVFFKSQAKVIVKQGAKLIINGGTLTSACFGYWEGIELWGDDEENQFPDQNDYYKQGYIELNNHATIENAICGILTSKKLFPLITDPSSAGGIIVAQESIFRNNIVSIDILPYINHHPIPPYDEFPNLSSFNDCRFFIDMDHPYLINNYEYMVSLDGVDGITFYNCQFGIEDSVFNINTLPEILVFLNNCEDMDFRGCDFQNNFSLTECPTHMRCTGIHAQNSEVNVESICIQSHPQYGCIWDTTLFKGLTYGIHASTASALMPFRAEVANFENNVKGIFLSGYDFAEITINRFIMNHGLASTVDTLYGLYLDQCNAYHVEANLFKGNLSLPDYIFGCVVRNSGEEANEIYNNSFIDLNIGLEPQRDNRGIDDGLCLKCNDFEGNEYDIYIFGGIVDEGIAFYQGIPDPTADPTKPAGNTFSSQPSHQYDIFNECDTIVYVYHGENNTQFRIIPDEEFLEGKIGLHPNANAYYSKELACPSKLDGGGGPETPKSAMALNEQKADSTQTELYALIDGGDTDELNTDVVMSFPDEALEVRQQLLDESPYLSDSVMKSAIYKEDVLPNAMIRDVLVANPQSAKSDEVLDALDYRWDPMPDYMMGEIMAGKDSLGSKEIMEIQIKGYKHLRNLAFNELVGIYLRDTVNSWAPDSLEALLQNENRLSAKYNLAFYYLKNGDTALMNSELSNIPTAFTLLAGEQQTHQDYLIYIGLLQALQYDTINGHYPDSSQTATLFALADTCYDLPSAYARNMLIHFGLITYDEPVYFPLALSSSVTWQNPFKEIDFPKSSSLSLFPNPAGDYFIVEYAIAHHYEQAMIVIHDMKGKLVRSFQIKGKQNQVVIPTGDLNNGVYIVSLYINNKLEDSKKITILQ